MFRVKRPMRRIYLSILRKYTFPHLNIILYFQLLSVHFPVSTFKENALGIAWNSGPMTTCSIFSLF